MTAKIQAAPFGETIYLRCPLSGCGAIVASRATNCGYGHIADIDAASARQHEAEHTAEESQYSDLIPTWFHCGMPWEHEEHVYGYGPRQMYEISDRGDKHEYTIPQEGMWVCPGIAWEETPR